MTTTSPTPRWLAAAAERRPGHTALVCARETLDYATLEARAVRRAQQLATKGLEPRGRVAILMENSVETVVMIHAAMAAGAVLVPLNTRLLASELRAPLEDAQPALLVADEDLVGRAYEAAAGLPATRVLSVPELAASVPRTVEPVAEHLLDDDCTLLFTSGTSGRPKGVRLSYGNHRASARAAVQRLEISHDDRTLLCLPLHHVGGLAIVMRSAIFGTTVVLHERFDAAAVTKSLLNERITQVSLVSTMLGRLLDQTPGLAAPPTLRCVLLGGGPAPDALLQRAWRAHLPIAPTYGLTEAASQVASVSATEARTRSVRSALPVADTEIRIADSDGKALPAGQAGEILVRGPQVMRGYLDPTASARALRDDWLHTGDIGVLDAEGRLSVLDRRTDLIVSGGENVYPAEVESVLLDHPDVREAAVIGQADREWGQRVCAFVVLEAGASLDAPALIAHCRTRLAGFKIPRRFERVDALPRTVTGKLQRQRLRDGLSMWPLGAAPPP
jgi:o-succinylbenzoate---CoA ligase